MERIDLDEEVRRDEADRSGPKTSHIHESIRTLLMLLWYEALAHNT